MINLKSIKEQIISDVTKIVAEKYNAKEDEIKVSFTGGGSIKATITPDLSFLSCSVKVEEKTDEN